MSSKWFKRTVLLLLVLAVAAGFAWLWWPQPILIDLAEAASGPMEVTITEDGVNRIKNTYVVSSPVTAKVERNSLHVGDKVVAGVTLVANLRPAEPPILDQRTRLELDRAIEAARAARDYAEVGVRQALSNVTFADTALKRAVRLMSGHVMSKAEYDKAELDMSLADQGLATARAQLDLRQHDVEAAEARLLPPGAAVDRAVANGCCIRITSPINGVVLSVIQSSEGTVAPGTPLVEIGDLQDSEVAVDLLSTDAVSVAAGARARISGWGGTGDFNARVREIEPRAFTKVSALGIEEQRVKVLLDYDGKPDRRNSLGQNFRVVVQITAWSADNVLQVPVGALIRKGDQWAVFTVKQGKAILTNVEIGHSNGVSAEVVDGLQQRQAVIVHPSDQITGGSAVKQRLP